jgi:hypothetical protein
VRTGIRKIVDNLTIDSELLKDDLRGEMLGRAEEFKTGFADIMEFGGRPDVAATVIDAAYGRFLKRQISTQYLRPLHKVSMDKSNSELTIFEGRFIPLLLSDEIEGGRGCARRVYWKQLNTEQEQLDFLMSLLNLVRKGDYEEPDFTAIGGGGKF